MKERPKGPVCQSCGMPMSQPDHFGTNGDGTKNGDYCAMCYQNGRFTEMDITMEQMIEKVASILVEQMKLPEEEAMAIAKDTVPELKRWKK